MAYYDPTFDVNFAAGDNPVTKYGFTFTRATSATYVNAAGLIATAASGELRYTYDPVTLSALGVLIEEARTNLNTSWLNCTASSGCTVSGSQSDALGGVSASLITESSAISEAHYANTDSGSVTLTLSTVYTISVLVKPGTDTRFQLILSSGRFGAAYANFSLSGAGSVLASGVVSSAGIERSANGYYRAWVVATCTSGGTGTAAFVGFLNSDAMGRAAAYVGSGNTLLFSGCQVEVGAFPTSHIPTTGTAATRNADVLSLTGAADVVASWFNKDSGTIVATAITNCGSAATNTARVFTFSDGTVSNRIGMLKAAGTLAASNVVASGGVTQANITYAGNWSAATSKIAAMAYSLNDVAMYLSGTAGTADVAATMPSGLTTFGVGINHASVEQWNGTISRIRYYNSRIPNADLILLSNGVDLSTPRTGGGIPKRKRKPRRIVVDDVIYDVPERDLPAFIDSVIQARSVPASVEVTVDQRPDTGVQQAVAPEVRLPPRGETPESLQARADALRVHLMRQQADRALLVLIDRTIARLMAEIEDEEEAAIALLLH